MKVVPRPTVKNAIAIEPATVVVTLFAVAGVVVPVVVPPFTSIGSVVLIPESAVIAPTARCEFERLNVYVAGSEPVATR